jgi:hypothetical protein
VELIWARAAGLVRRAWRASVMLALLAGLVAGVSMAMVAAGRRTATAYDRFLAYADVAELLVNFCPPEVEPGSDLSVCQQYEAVEEQRLLSRLPEVEAAARGAFRGVTVAPAARPDDRAMASTLVSYQDDFDGSLAGQLLVVEGRSATRADEVVLNEALAERSGLGVGDRAVLVFWGQDEIGTFNDDDPPELTGPTVEVEVVGLGRGLMDLAATQAGFSQSESGMLFPGPGLAAATASAEEFGGVLVQATDDDAAAAAAAIERAISPQIFNAAPALAIDEIEPTRDAIRYEAQATMVLGLVVAVLSVAFVGQAIARQSRREWADGPILRAVGVTTTQATATAALRSLSISIPAAVIGVVAAILLSPRGPVGVGRRAEVDPGIRIDAMVLAVGALAVLVVGALAACAPLLRGRALRGAVIAPPRRRPQRSLTLPAVPTAGLHLARTGQGRGVEVVAALASAAAAVVAIVAAGSLAASLDDLTTTPARFGAPWDVSIGVPFGDEASVVSLLDDPDHRADIEAAAFIRGQDLRIGTESAWVHAFVPIEGIADEAPPLPIDEGRPPATDREIAVGALTLADAGLSIGDRVMLVNEASGQEAEVTVVGTAMINDNFEASPGRGGVVTPDLIAELASEMTAGDPAIVTLRPGADADGFVDAVRRGIDTPVQPPIRQAAVRNVERIRELPYVMAAVVALLAMVSLVHALVLSVSRNRRVLGVLKGLGFTRRQVGGTIAWHATSYALVATVVALPLGVMAGRWAWRMVTRSLGVPDVPVLPVAVLVWVVIALLVLANLAAAYPGWRAARLSTAAALRAE